VQFPYGDLRRIQAVQRTEAEMGDCSQPKAGDERAIRRAIKILEKSFQCPGAALNSPGTVRDYLALQLGREQREVFCAIWLDAQHRVIAFEQLFRGTLTQTNVYPREVVKAALARNAAAVIFAHNHPSGVAQPSQSDELLTRNLTEALALIEVKVLDHFIVAGASAISFAERGLL
jgi:DNA repair protein RadC